MLHRHLNGPKKTTTTFGESISSVKVGDDEIADAYETERAPGEEIEVFDDIPEAFDSDDDDDTGYF